LGKSDIEACIAFRNGLPGKIGENLFIDPNHTLNDLAERAKQIVRTNSLMQGGISLEATQAMPQFAAAAAAAPSTADNTLQKEVDLLERAIVQLQQQQFETNQCNQQNTGLTAADVENLLRKHKEEDRLNKVASSSRELGKQVQSLSDRMESLLYASTNQGGNGRPPPRPFNNGQQNDGQRNSNNNFRRQNKLTREEVKTALSSNGKNCPLHPGRHSASDCNTLAGILSKYFDPNFKPTPFPQRTGGQQSDRPAQRPTSN
jgi:hypothetical protein